MKKELADIKYLFEPGAVAVIGASSDKKKIGFKIMDNIVSNNFTGTVYPVNPKGGEVFGIEMKKSILDIEEELDLAVIAIPAKFVFESVRECAKKGVKHLSIISSGFSEVGNIEEEKEILNFAHENGMRILGPNIFGNYSAKCSLNATFGPKEIDKGNVAILTQSGALGIAMIGKSAVESIGLSSIVSLGNKSDIDENDLLEYLLVDEHTKTILIYMEGVQNGERLLKTLRKVTKVKPVIVIKSGRSKRGAIAAASHTGSLAGADEIFDDVMKQCGVLRAESLQEAFDWAKFLANTPEPAGENCIIITNGGGVGVMATDACEKYSIQMYDNPEELAKIFGPVTPDFGSTKNPIDLTGQANADFYRQSLEAALNNENIDSVLSLYCETVISTEDLINTINENDKKFKEAKKPLLFSLYGGEEIENAITPLRKNGLSVFSDVYNTVSCLGALYKQKRFRQRDDDIMADRSIDIAAINKVIDTALADKRSFLLTHEAHAVMKACAIPIPQTKIAKNLNEVVQFTKDISYPLVMKVVSRDILHKSDAGGVVLNLENLEEVIDAYEVILHNCKKHYPNATIDGVEITEMVKRGTEVIIGSRKDRTFGPTVMFGLGGIYVEVMKDVAFRSFPLSEREIGTMIKETKAYPLLLGVRGEEKKDMESVIDIIIKLGKIVHECKRITDIEINPLMVYEVSEGVKAVDVRILLSSGGGSNE